MAAGGDFCLFPSVQLFVYAYLCLSNICVNTNTDSFLKLDAYFIGDLGLSE